MGIVVDEGKQWQKECRVCKNKIVLIASGDDICNCPYCGATLMDCEPTTESLDMQLGTVQSLILKYRNTTNAEAKKDLQARLRNEVHWLLNDLVFYGRDQRRWHDWHCESCEWSGYGPFFTTATSEPTCPECSGKVQQK